MNSFQLNAIAVVITQQHELEGPYCCTSTGGTGLCSCRVRGVDGSCAKHLTVESYMVIYALNSYTLVSFSSPTLSFIPDLKLSFSANPSHYSLSFSSSELTT